MPSSDGILAVEMNDKLIFSNKEKDRYPEEGEVEALIREELS